jgi:hypothetical protein
LNREPCTSIGIPVSRMTYRRRAVLAFEDAAFQMDPWEKAADCERALRLTVDPLHRNKLKDVREFWISLAYARPFLNEKEFAKRAEAIGRVHAKI